MNNLIIKQSKKHIIKMYICSHMAFLVVHKVLLNKERFVSKEICLIYK